MKPTPGRFAAQFDELAEELMIAAVFHVERAQSDVQAAGMPDPDRRYQQAESLK